MKRCKGILSLFMSFVFISTIFFIVRVKAEELNFNVYKYEWKTDSLVSGNNYIEKTFYVPQNMNCYNFNISLKIRQSPTLVRDLSSISVSINGLKVYSIMIDKLGADGTLTAKVPDYLIYKGENSIVVKGFLKSTREKCEINNDVNWFVVEKTSYFSFNHIRTDSAYISNIFDDTYYSDGLNEEINIALPDNLIADNYSQISSIAALIGFMYKNKETDVKINNFKYSELSGIDKETMVIGTVQQLKAFDKALFNDREWESAEENGYIGIRKIGVKNHFIIMISNESQLETLCRILQNKSLLSQIKDKDYILDKNKIINEKPFNSNPSLKLLGYENLSQIGNGIKEFDYYFTIPAQKTITSNNKLTFAYNYSSLADYDKGYVVAAVNGEDMVSKELEKDKVQDKLEFTIPEKYFDYTGFNISLKFNLKPEAERCTAQNYDDIWVTIDSISSNFRMELKDRKKYSLLNAQGLLQNSNGYVDGSIAVDNFHNLLIDSICQISSYIGEVSQGVNELLIEEAKDNKSSYGAIFTLTTSPIVKTINDNLRISISDDDKFINKDLFIQNTPSLGAAEVTLNGDTLIIIADNKEELNSTIQKYSSVASPKDIVILKAGKIIGFFGEAKVSVGTNLGIIKTNYELLSALAVLLGASIFIFIIYSKKVKK